MYILGIDSTTKRMSISVSYDKNVLYELEDDKSQGFIINIISFINKVLTKSRIPLQKIDAYCVNTGPGDFTGTRIGISIVKTLAWVQSKPVYGINSPDVFAAGIALNNRKRIEKYLSEGRSLFICPLLDVKRGELYFALYKIIEGGIESEIGNGIINNFKAIKTIVRIQFKNKLYLICRVSGYHLVEKNNFIKDFKSMLFSNIDYAYSSVSSHEAMKEDEIIFGGNAFESYKDLENQITVETRSKITDINNKDLRSDFISNKLFIFDKKNKFPKAGNLNLCAYYNADLENKPGDLNIIPVYVRDFAPFPQK